MGMLQHWQASLQAAESAHAWHLLAVVFGFVWWKVLHGLQERLTRSQDKILCHDAAQTSSMS
jgi:hypothetical protein